MRMTDLQPGWAVVANDGRRIGSVKEVGQNYVRMSLGGGSDLYVPASAIANVASEVVHLSVTSSDARNMGWEQPPRTDDTLETSVEDDRHRHI